MQGHSGATDGTRHTVTLSVSHDDLELAELARFDEVEVKDPVGVELSTCLTERSTGGTEVPFRS